MSNATIVTREDADKYLGNKGERPLPRMKLLYSTENGHIKIEQRSKRVFRTTYGLQVRTFSNWQEAFADFGYCLAHYLECEGKLSR